jgi:hypothetical protein
VQLKKVFQEKRSSSHCQDGSIQFNDESSDSTLLKKSKISLVVEGESLQFDREKIRNSEGREFIFHDFIYSHFFRISSTLTTAPPVAARKDNSSRFFHILSLMISLCSHE